MLALQLIAPNDYTVLEDGQPIGRIRLARERKKDRGQYTRLVSCYSRAEPHIL
jgi:hypothetical protein